MFLNIFVNRINRNNPRAIFISLINLRDICTMNNAI